jgi:Flp pilus assembly protein CpaB
MNARRGKVWTLCWLVLVSACSSEQVLVDGSTPDGLVSPESVHRDQRISERLPTNLRGVTVEVSGGQWARVHDHVDLLATLEQPWDREPRTITLIQDVIILRTEAGRPASRSKAGQPLPSTTLLTLALLPDEGGAAFLASLVGSLYCTLRNPDVFEDLLIVEPAIPATMASQEHAMALHQLRKQTIQANQSPKEEQEPAGPPSGRLSSSLRKGGRAITVPIEGCAGIEPGEHVDILGAFRDLKGSDPKQRQCIGLTLIPDTTALSIEAPLSSSCDPEHSSSVQQLTVQVLPEEAENLALAVRIGRLMCALRSQENATVDEGALGVTMDTLLTGERLRALHRLRHPTIH